MGTRFQAYLIARIKRKRRVVASVHHQYCEGSDAAKALLLLLRLLKSPATQRALLHELSAPPAQGDEQWPLAAYALTWAFYAERGLHNGLLRMQSCGPELRLWECGGWNNNSGALVVDITDPAVPLYACLDSCSSEIRTVMQLLYNDPPAESSYLITAGLPLIRIEHMEEALANPDRKPFSYFAEPVTVEVSSAEPATAPEEKAASVSTLALHALTSALRGSLDEADDALDTVIKLVQEGDEAARSALTALGAHEWLSDGHFAVLEAAVGRLYSSRIHPVLDVTALGLHPKHYGRLFNTSSFESAHLRVLRVRLAGSAATVVALEELLTHWPRSLTLAHLDLYDSVLTSDELAHLASSSPALFYNVSNVAHPAAISASSESAVPLKGGIGWVLVNGSKISCEEERDWIKHSSLHLSRFWSPQRVVVALDLLLQYVDAALKGHSSPSKGLFDLFAPLGLTAEHAGPEARTVDTERTYTGWRAPELAEVPNSLLPEMLREHGGWFVCCKESDVSKCSEIQVGFVFVDSTCTTATVYRDVWEFLVHCGRPYESAMESLKEPRRGNGSDYPAWGGTVDWWPEGIKKQYTRARTDLTAPAASYVLQRMLPDKEIEVQMHDSTGCVCRMFKPRDHGDGAPVEEVATAPQVQGEVACA